MIKLLDLWWILSKWIQFLSKDERLKLMTLIFTIIQIVSNDGKSK